MTADPRNIRKTVLSNGLTILTASKDQTARIWDSTSGRLLRTLAGHSADVVSARYSPDGRRAPPRRGDGLRLGTYRDLWADEVTDRNPALRFLAPPQTVELAPADGERLGLTDGDRVEVRSNGTGVRARVALRERIRPGAAFLIEGTAAENANAFAGAEDVELVKEGDAR